MGNSVLSLITATGAVKRETRANDAEGMRVQENRGDWHKVPIQHRVLYILLKPRVVQI